MTKRNITAFVLLAAACATFCGCPSSTAEGPQVGETAPPVIVKTWVKGGPYDLLDGAGVYVLEFWASWCPPCRRMIPHMTELQAQYAEAGVVIVALSQEDESEVVAFVEEQGDAMDYCVAVDDAYATAGPYGVTSIPHVFVISPGGTIAWRGHPSDSALEETLDSLIAN